MSQFLIREFTDNTGHVHVNAEQPREDEKIYIVEANDKEQALKIHMALRIREAMTTIFRNVKKFVEGLNKE